MALALEFIIFSLTWNLLSASHSLAGPNFLASCEAENKQSKSSYQIQIRTIESELPATRKVDIKIFERFINDSRPGTTHSFVGQGLVLLETGIDLVFPGGAIKNNKITLDDKSFPLMNCRFAKVSDFVPKKSISCPSGQTSESFSLQNKPGQEADISKIKILPGVDFVKLNVSKPDEFTIPEKVFGFRLDLCLDNSNQAILRRVILGTKMLRVYDERNSLFKAVRGISNAIAGDSSKLWIEIEETGSNTRPGAGMRVQSIEGSANGVLVYPMYLDQAVEGYFVGELEYGNPFLGPCSLGTLGTWLHTVGTATLEGEVCARQGAGNSAIYDFLTLHIIDRNLKLAPQFREKQIVLPPDRLNELFLHHESHHNWCDRFYLKVPETGAQYIVAPNPKQTENYPAFGTAVNYGDGWEILVPPHEENGPCYGDERIE